MVIGAGDFASVHEGLEETIGGAGADRDADDPRARQQRDRRRPARGGGELAGGEGPARRGATIEGVEFFGLGAGVPVTPWDWSFDLDEDAAAAMLARLPAGGGLWSSTRRPGATATARERASTSAARRCSRRSRRSGRASPSAATSTSPGAVESRIGADADPQPRPERDLDRGRDLMESSSPKRAGPRPRRADRRRGRRQPQPGGGQRRPAGHRQGVRRRPDDAQPGRGRLLARPRRPRSSTWARSATATGAR